MQPRFILSVLLMRILRICGEFVEKNGDKTYTGVKTFRVCKIFFIILMF